MCETAPESGGKSGQLLEVGSIHRFQGSKSGCWALSFFFFFNLKTILSWVKVADACDPSTREGRAGRSPRI